jgi:hypothetical protein
LFLSLDNFYSAEVVNKLRQKEQTQSFINKACSLFITDRSLVIYDRAAQVKSIVVLFCNQFIFRLLRKQFQLKMLIQHVSIRNHRIHLMIYLCIVHLIDMQEEQI